MRPTDLRNSTWADVQTHITEDMVSVHRAYQQHGPGTTRDVAERSGIPLLTLRPRTSDLYKLGLVILVDHEGTEGIYAYRSLEDAEVSCAWQERADFRKKKPDASESLPIRGFLTVEEAINSMPVADRAALGARLMAKYGSLLKRREAGSTDNLQLALG